MKPRMGDKMDNETKRRLEAKGYTVGNAGDVLDLSPQEEALVDTGLVLAALVRDTRETQGWTQKQLAEKLGTKQLAIALMEDAVGSSFETLFAALFIMGVQPREIALALMDVTLKTPAKEVALT